jgi:hypothetical protein
VRRRSRFDDRLQPQIAQPGAELKRHMVIPPSRISWRVMSAISCRNIGLSVRKAFA